MLLKLLEAYVTYGLAFALMHGVLTIFVIKSLVDFARWNPTAEHARPSWESLEIRSQFIRGLIGLYLLIGIAGTFYGLFEFAVKAAADAPSIITALTSAVAKAFPVGFVGLVSGLGFHVIFDILEKRKTKLFEAVNRSDTAELRELVRSGFESSERALGHQTAQLRDGLRELASSIQTALQPVATLQNTLGQTLEPVVKRLGESLEVSTKLLRDQGERLEAGKEALVEASARLAQSAKRVESAFSEIGNVTDEARRALEQARTSTEQAILLYSESRQSISERSLEASAALGSAVQLFSKSREELEQAGIGLRQLPDNLEVRLAAQAQAFAAETTGYLRNDLERLYTETAGQLVQAVGDVGTQMAVYREQVEAITADIDTVAANFENTQSLLVATINDGIRKQSDDYGNEIRTHVDRVFGPFEAADGRVEEFQRTLSAFVTGLETLDSQRRAMVESHRQALERIDGVVTGLSQAPAAAARQREQLESLLRECLVQFTQAPAAAARQREQLESLLRDCLEQLKNPPKPVAAAPKKPAGLAGTERAVDTFNDSDIGRTSAGKSHITRVEPARETVSFPEPAKEPPTLSWFQKLRQRFGSGGGR